MSNSEPISLTLDRNQRMGGLFPDVTASSPQDVIAADVAGAAGGQAPSPFSQTALALANYSPADEGDSAPNVTGAVGNSAAADNQDPGMPAAPSGGFDLGGFLGTLGKGVLSDVGGALKRSGELGSYLPLPAQQQQDVNRFIGGLGTVGQVANAIPGFAVGGPELGLARGVGGAIGSVLAPKAVDALLPQDTNPLVRGGLDLGASVLGGGAGIAGGGRASSWANAARQALDEAAANEAMVKAAPEAFQQNRALPPDLGTALPTEGGARYVRSLAGGAEEPTPEAPFGGGEELPGGMARAREAAGRPAVQGSEGVATPQESLLDAIRQAKPLQEQNKELLSQFRSRQAGAFAGAAQSGTGEAGFNRALGAMRGEADRVTFPPLRDALAPEQVNPLFDAVTSHPDLRPFEKAQAGTALRNILDGTVPTPSALGELETVFPGISKALQAANIIKGPSLLERIPTNLTDINNSIRSSNTLLDFAFMGRLGRQAGLMQPGTYARAVGQAWHSLADPEIVNTVWRNIDERAAASGGPTVEEMRTDYGLRAFNSDTAPGLFGKVPVLGRAAKVYQNFQALLRPQMLEQEIQNRLDAGTLTQADLHNPEVTQDLGRAINLLTGSSSLKIGPDSNLLLEFPNWLAAQGELIFRGMQRGSITSSMARQSLMRLVAFGTATTAALNLAQGKSPLANVKNGVPMANVPGSDLTIDMFGPLGELVSKAGGIVASTVNGAETPQGLSASGAVSGAGKGAFDAYRGLASPLAGIAIDQLTGKNYIGQPVSTPGQRITNLIEHVLPFNVSSAAQGREVPAQVLGAAGERVHQPGTNAKVADGNYDTLAPEDQPRGMLQQGWQLAKSAQGAPPELAQYNSYYDWRDAQVKTLTPEAKAALPDHSDKEIAAAVQKKIDQDPVSQAWTNARAYLKDQWVMQHPQLALDLYAKNPKYGQPGYVAGYDLTQEQLAGARALLTKPSPPRSANVTPPLPEMAEGGVIADGKVTPLKVAEAPQRKTRKVTMRDASGKVTRTATIEEDVA